MPIGNLMSVYLTLKNNNINTINSPNNQLKYENKITIPFQKG
jgi:hypothetical protein